MTGNQKDLVYKYHIATVLMGVVFFAASYVFPIDSSTSLQSRYALPVIVVSVLVFFFYLDRLKGFAKIPSARRGGIFYVAFCFFAGMLVTSSLSISIGDNLTQHVEEVGSLESLKSNKSEYIHVTNYKPILDEFIYKWDLDTHTSGKSTSGTRTTNTINFTGYVPVDQDTGDSIYHAWIMFTLDSLIYGQLTRQEKEQFEKSVIEQGENMVRNFEFNSIVYFSRDSILYSSLPNKDKTTGQGKVLVLTPSLSTLGENAKGTLLGLGIFYAIISALYIACVSLIDRTDSKAAELEKLKR